MGLLLPIQPQQQRLIESDFYVEGYATTFDKPYVLAEWDRVKYYEVIDRQALSGADISDVKLLYNHEGHVYARNKNKSLILAPDEIGLLIAADLGLTDGAKRMYEEIRQGLIDEMSWSFSVGAYEYNKDTRTTTITKIKKIYDVSPVSYPANPATSIEARNASLLDGVIRQERAERLAQRRLEIRKKILEGILHESH